MQTRLGLSWSLKRLVLNFVLVKCMQYTFPEPFCLRLDFVSPRVGFKEVNGSNADNILTYLYFCIFTITSRVQLCLKV